jgi:hypothetical protein
VGHHPDGAPRGPDRLHGPVNLGARPAGDVLGEEAVEALDLGAEEQFRGGLPLQGAEEEQPHQRRILLGPDDHLPHKGTEKEGVLFAIGQDTSPSGSYGGRVLASMMAASCGPHNNRNMSLSAQALTYHESSSESMRIRAAGAAPGVDWRVSTSQGSQSTGRDDSPPGRIPAIPSTRRNGELLRVTVLNGSGIHLKSQAGRIRSPTLYPSTTHRRPHTCAAPAARTTPTAETPKIPRIPIFSAMSPRPMLDRTTPKS